MRYIGGKSQLTPQIIELIKTEAPETKTVLDVFAGSGAVSEALIDSGYDVINNDILYFSYVLQRGKLGINDSLKFEGLNKIDPIEFLNKIDASEQHAAKDCFIYYNYSPVGECKRMYFQPENALKIDLIRQQIESWKKQNKITEDEYYYLLSSLLQAVPYVANITGVYAAYLKYWDNRTFKKIELKPHGVANNNNKCICLNMDYKQALDYHADLLYADPPYNSREYLPNYHILETIAKYDYPVIHGVTGMREYESEKSPFCKKAEVENAFNTLIEKSNVSNVVISYNNEGLISTEKLISICKSHAVPGSFKLLEFNYRRYKNKIPNEAEGLKEQLYFFRRK